MIDLLAEKRAGARVRVWDLPTRLFHWCLVGLVSFALVTGLFAPKWWVGPHMYAGYGIAGLLIFRAVWAFYGSEYSRLASFAYAPRQVISHMRGLLKLRSAHYFGHNPSGAMMIFALIGLLGLLVTTGFLVQGGLEKQGPLASFLPYGVGLYARHIHKFLALLLLCLIGLHLAGVLVGSRLLKEPLIGPMITGWKPGLAPSPPSPARPLPALLWLGILGAVIAGVVPPLSRRPPLGVPPLPANPTMIAECGACHWPFHPSLLPRASWALLMAGLSDHFGEDASLPAAKRDEIAAYLSRYAAEAWDTQAAHLFAVVAPGNPISITATPGWQRIHAHLDPAFFRLRSVGSNINCGACHKDAGTGRFDPQAIALPRG
jgi:cytochrome b